MGGDERQAFFLPAPVFHHLAGKFDRVPGDAIDAGNFCHVHPRQHVVQAVAEFVKEGDGVVVAQERGLLAHRLAVVADEVGDGFLQAAIG